MTYRLTPAQSLAWHSDDAKERDLVRAEIRRAALAQLGLHSDAARIADYGGRRLETLPAPAR